ncbi:MAG TPA: UDP-N-acetylglucosamine 2-epimerase (non-hydrolyzing) [Vicinamibacteria bacterium]|nr:UDP-N-acetylglucosamine 2-epimerase (non-hydrolyzing) [Vicinamibacteria bacterium]
MSDLRVVDLVAGARPNFMKLAPVLRAMGASPGPLRARVVHTGQHYDEGMSGVFFRDLGIGEPDVYLGVGSGTHGQQTARILAAYEEHLLGTSPRPAAVVVVGDVNSTMACTLAAVKLGIPVAHVEAGLRSFDRSMPEEVNRVVTDALADLLLVSEPAGEENLRREGIPEGRIRYVGNVMIDTLVRELPAARALGVASRLALPASGFLYVTLHRPSNVDDPGRLARVVAMLRSLGLRLPVVFPVHPRTRERLCAAGLDGALVEAPGVRVLEPLGYRESLGLMAEARLVLTDSGGVQEETSHLGVPCLTLRPNTERPVTVSLGTNTVVGEEIERVEPLVAEVLAGRYKSPQPIPGWDGRAAERVAAALVERYGRSPA